MFSVSVYHIVETIIQVFGSPGTGEVASLDLLAPTTFIFHIHSEDFALRRPRVLSTRNFPRKSPCFHLLGILFAICADRSSSCLLLEPSL